MKRFFFICIAALAILAVSCDKDNKPDVPKEQIPVPEAVDLGIVVNGNNVKWASFNLGASKEFEYGNYYAWGETKPKTDYSWATYTFSKDGIKFNGYWPVNKPDKWCGDGDTPDGLTQLKPEHDAATAALKGKWRMPTSEELSALKKTYSDKDNYTWTFEAYMDENGEKINDSYGKVICGWWITYKVTKAKIFLPTSGAVSGENNNQTGKAGLFWSANNDGREPEKAYYMYFTNSDTGTSSDYRCSGISIRPVCD